MHGGLKIADKVRAMRAFKGLRRLSSWVNQVLGGSAGGSLLSSAPFFAQLTKSLVLNRGTGSPTFTRATTATVTDNEGILRTAIAGEARFTGARRVYNRVVGASENLTNAAWVGVNATSPNATTVLASAGNAPHYRRQIQAANAAGSVWIIKAKLTAGTHNCAVLGDDGDASYHSVSFDLSLGTKGQEQNATGTITPLGGGQYLCTAKFTRTNAGTVRPCIGLVTNASTTIDGGLNAAGTETIIAEEIQLEDITGRTEQSTPSEYVSVGVLSAPYHGTGVDGVKCFDTDLSGNPLPTSPTYGYAQLNGVAGTYVSTPDSVANSITGDIDIRVKVAMADWTPAADTVFVSKMNAAGTRSYRLFSQAATPGKLVFQWTADGSTQLAATSTAAVSFVDGGTGWVRVTFDVDNGASGNTATFYTSTDGVPWTILGTAVVTAGATSIADTTAAVEIGSFVSGTTGNLNGKIYRAQIYNGINGTLAVDFDASRYAGGTTLTGSTGETWTLNGSAYIPETNFPLKGYNAEGAATNLCLQSQTFGTTWTVSGASIGTNATTAPDGTTTADSLIEDASAASPHFTTQAISKAATSAAYTFSVYAKKAGRDWVALTLYDNTALGARGWFNINTGVVGSTANIGAGMGTVSLAIQDVGSGWYRCSMSVTASGTALRIDPYIYSTNADSVLSLNGLNAAGAYLWGAQLELGSSATSYIPTTTGAVARNADVLTYPSAGNLVTLNDYTVSLEAQLQSSAITSGSLFGGSAGYQPYVTASLESNKVDGYSNSTGTGPATASLSDSNKTNSIFKVAQRKDSTNVTVAASGSVGTPAAKGTQGAEITSFTIGGLGAGTIANGHIRNVRIWSRALSSSELQAITR